MVPDPPVQSQSLDGLFSEVARLRAKKDAPEKAYDWVGNCELIRELGAGAFGKVWLAQQEEPDRRVAVKIVPFGFAPEARRQATERLRAEGQFLTRLDHPHIPRCWGAGSLSSGRPYLILHYIDLPNRDEEIPVSLVERARTLHLRDWLQMFQNVADAVAHAHRQFIHHRDLSPGNVVVDRQGKVWVIDFGIARPTVELEGMMESSMARPFSRSAPEQMDPGTYGSTSVRTDVFQLGVLLHELLVGELPFGVEKRKERGQMDDHWLKRVASGKVELAGALRHREGLGFIPAAELEAIVRKCLNPLQAERYPSVDALLNDLQAHLENRTVTAWEKQGTGVRSLKFLQRNLVPLAIATLVVSLLSAAAIYSNSMARAAVLARRYAEDAQAKTLVALTANDIALADTLRRDGKPLGALEHLVRATEADPAQSFRLRDLLRSQTWLVPAKAPQADFGKPFLEWDYDPLSQTIVACDATGVIKIWTKEKSATVLPIPSDLQKAWATRDAGKGAETFALLAGGKVLVIELSFMEWYVLPVVSDAESHAAEVRKFLQGEDNARPSVSGRWLVSLPSGHPRKAHVLDTSAGRVSDILFPASFGLKTMIWNESAQGDTLIFSSEGTAYCWTEGKLSAPVTFEPLTDPSAMGKELFLTTVGKELRVNRAHVAAPAGVLPLPSESMPLMRAISEDDRYAGAVDGEGRVYFADLADPRPKWVLARPRLGFGPITFNNLEGRPVLCCVPFATGRIFLISPESPDEVIESPLEISPREFASPDLARRWPAYAPSPEGLRVATLRRLTEPVADSPAWGEAAAPALAMDHKSGVLFWRDKEGRLCARTANGSVKWSRSEPLPGRLLWLWFDGVALRVLTEAGLYSFSPHNGDALSQIPHPPSLALILNLAESFRHCGSCLVVDIGGLCEVYQVSNNGLVEAGTLPAKEGQRWQVILRPGFLAGVRQGTDKELRKLQVGRVETGSLKLGWEKDIKSTNPVLTDSSAGLVLGDGTDLRVLSWEDGHEVRLLPLGELPVRWMAGHRDSITPLIFQAAPTSFSRVLTMTHLETGGVQILDRNPRQPEDAGYDSNGCVWWRCAGQVFTYDAQHNAVSGWSRLPLTVIPLLDEDGVERGFISGTTVWNGAFASQSENANTLRVARELLSSDFSEATFGQLEPPPVPLPKAPEPESVADADIAAFTSTGIEVRRAFPSGQGKLSVSGVSAVNGSAGNAEGMGIAINVEMDFDLSVEPSDGHWVIRTTPGKRGGSLQMGVIKVDLADPNNPMATQMVDQLMQGSEPIRFTVNAAGIIQSMGGDSMPSLQAGEDSMNMALVVPAMIIPFTEPLLLKKGQKVKLGKSEYDPVEIKVRHGSPVILLKGRNEGLDLDGEWWLDCQSGSIVACSASIPSKEMPLTVKMSYEFTPTNARGVNTK